MDMKICRIISMMVLSFTYFFIEIGVGYYTNSIALIADSFHMLSDVVALVIAFVAIKVSVKKSDRNTFGWARAEVLGALVNAVFLLGLCFNILIEAIQRLFTDTEVTDPILVAIVGSVGLFINLIGLVMFNGQGHGHSHGLGHGHSHGQNENSYLLQNDSLSTTGAQITSGDQMNMKGVFLHILGDALASIVVIVSALAIHFIESSWTVYIDPGISIVVVIIIVSTSYPLLKESSMILLQSLPINIDFKDLSSRVKKELSEDNLHEFHVWQLSGDVVIATAHVVFDGNDVSEYMKKAEMLRQMFHRNGIHSTTIQPEFVNAPVVNSENALVVHPAKVCIIGCSDLDCGDKKCCSSVKNNSVQDNTSQSDV
ncbi:zinc transporter 1-like [Anneissia japonica]|uniref:zinc transporter 1-like n=1 Tax=Anneissia japonica TaxID=1529436 RepID=UPI00142554D1|nr:zinc transporter 1-like [Anneissia japonica]